MTPWESPSHPVLKHHVEHLDFMLHETRKDLEHMRVHAHRAQMALAHHVPEDQLQEMEDNGEDIQGGEAFLSDDNDFEEDEFTEEEDYEFLESGEEGIIPINVD
ncbi:hypothetical protein QYE76_041085 [Lolium multiflorum]|uniref:Uncharacterized protein n=1 Tax=Lolium multiflorum TaxID=4521 RepID=A0AAD8WTC6_LOLMU|nr:hypothetical protein QYE76_041085 [Lolium multiflorum]